MAKKSRSVRLHLTPLESVALLHAVCLYEAGPQTEEDGPLAVQKENDAGDKLRAAIDAAGVDVESINDCFLVNAEKYRNRLVRDAQAAMEREERAAERAERYHQKDHKA